MAGTVGLAYGSFSYTKETHEVKVGPIELSVKDKETVNVPVWAGVGAIVIGGVILLVGGNSRTDWLPWAEPHRRSGAVGRHPASKLELSAP